MKTFFIADHHFGHENIIKYEDRPFESVEEMDSYMIERWNRVVKKGDKVFVLGDFSIYGKEKTREIVDQLNGYKILIMGNHDKGRTLTWWKERGFLRVIEYPIIFNEFYMLSHEPLYVNDKMPYLNIHGHIHGRVIEGNYFNVGVERIHYTPITLEEIKEKMNIPIKLKEIKEKMNIQ